MSQIFGEKWENTIAGILIWRYGDHLFKKMQNGDARGGVLRARIPHLR